MNVAKVYNSDFVGENRDALIHLAKRVAREYNGNWDAMIQYKIRAMLHEEFTDEMSRRVLNMALGCSECSDDWTLIHNLLGRVVDSVPKPRPVLKIVRPESRKIWISAATRWKVFYAKSHVAHGVVHVIDQRLSFVEWEARHERDGGFDFEHRVPIMHLAWACGKTTRLVSMTYDFYKLWPVDTKACSACLVASDNPPPVSNRPSYKFVNPRYKETK